MKNEYDVLDIWERRGYITQKDRNENEEIHLTYIFQAKDEILSYCNIPLTSDVPSGLLYTWADIARDMRNHAEVCKEPLTVKSISAGDTSFTLAGNTQSGSRNILRGYTNILNRYRRMF
ncbi:MAG: hypothetical protein DBY45_10335 [Clostridiales bacterium]|nr:MAG: hypothetical protein DBY45_10335 [Clostridiales bacterium]